MAGRAQSTHTTKDLLLAGRRLRLSDQHGELVEHTTSVMVPPCTVLEPFAEPEWTVQVEHAPGAPAAKVDGPWPELTLAGAGGPRLTVLDDSGGRRRVLGRYRPGSGTAVMVADSVARTTQLVLPMPGDVSTLRWGDWLAKVFFASRLLAAGWSMLHASAVAVDGVALLFLAGQRGGKSTLAHRACVELGAALLADDLVLLGGDGTVVGWPTRISIPMDLQVPDEVGTVLDRIVDGDLRRRRVLTPREHRDALGVSHSGPVPLGAMAVIDTTGSVRTDGVRALRLGEEELLPAVVTALDLPVQRLFTSDLLGLAGGSGGGDAACADEDVMALLSRVSGALVRVDDPANLPTVPVWDELVGLVPGLRR